MLIKRVLSLLEGACKVLFDIKKNKVLRRVLRRERFIEGA